MPPFCSRLSVTKMRVGLSLIRMDRRGPCHSSSVRFLLVKDEVRMATTRWLGLRAEGFECLLTVARRFG